MTVRLLARLLLALFAVGCTEPNPGYDPLFVPPCEVGARQCGESLRNLLVCQETEGQNPTWTIEKTCWEGTACSTAWCGPGDSSACDLPSDCTGAGEVCTAVTDAEDHIGTYCIPSPFPGAREPGRACSRHEECASGWCFRRTCFHPCEETSQCPFSDTCETLNVTVDQVQDSLRGCVIP